MFGHIVQHPRTLPFVFSVILVVLSCLLVHSAFRKGGLWNVERFNDFKAYHQAAQMALDRNLEEAYSSDQAKPYQYPPTLATLIIPLGLLPYRVALVIWVLGSLFLLMWSFRVLDRVLCPPVKGIDKFFGFLLVYRMIESDFANTNANVLILGLLVLGFQLERRARSGGAGLILSLAASIKVAPLLLLPWMIYRGRWRMAGGFCGGLFLWGVLVPGTIIGPADYSGSMKLWYQGIVAPMNIAAEEFAEEAPGGYLPGQSLRVLFHRLLRPIDATAHDTENISIHLFDLSKQTVDVIGMVVSMLILGGLLTFFWKRKRDRLLWGGAEIATAIVLIVLLSPLARKAHFVVLFPAATYGFMLARVAEPGRRKILWALWWVALGLVVLTSPDILTDEVSAIVMGYCPFSWAAILLLVLPLLQPRDPFPSKQPP